jgi:hypothetical protein
MAEFGPMEHPPMTAAARPSHLLWTAFLMLATVMVAAAMSPLFAAAAQVVA